MFEKATRLKVRFDYNGRCAVEDLWDIPLSHLDQMFKELNVQYKTSKEESLLETRNEEDDILDLQIKLVRHVVEVRLKEQKEREDFIMKAQKKHRLMEIIADKQDEELKAKSVEELNQLIVEL